MYEKYEMYKLEKLNIFLIVILIYFNRILKYDLHYVKFHHMDLILILNYEILILLNIIVSFQINYFKYLDFFSTFYLLNFYTFNKHVYNLKS
jgi:hypothetical protein